MNSGFIGILYRVGSLVQASMLSSTTGASGSSGDVIGRCSDRGRGVSPPQTGKMTIEHQSPDAPWFRSVYEYVAGLLYGIMDKGYL